MYYKRNAHQTSMTFITGNTEHQKIVEERLQTSDENELKKTLQIIFLKSHYTFTHVCIYTHTW